MSTGGFPPCLNPAIFLNFNFYKYTTNILYFQIF